MKLPDASVYGATQLPPIFLGSYQTPDYVWATKHSKDSDHATIGHKADSATWSECIGEGKPVRAEDFPDQDHAVRQVMMAGAAALYHQISLTEARPEILLFTINFNIVRFFVMTASREEEERKWSIVCRMVDNLRLDLKDLMDCIRFRCLTRALRSGNEAFRARFMQLWPLAERRPETWWVINKGKRNRRVTSESVLDNLDNSDSHESDSKPMKKRMHLGDSGRGEALMGLPKRVEESLGLGQSSSGGGRKKLVIKWGLKLQSMKERTRRSWRLLTSSLSV
jgi:hypothetical protein